MKREAPKEVDRRGEEPIAKESKEKASLVLSPLVQEQGKREIQFIK